MHVFYNTYPTKVYIKKLIFKNLTLLYSAEKNNMTMIQNCFKTIHNIIHLIFKGNFALDNYIIFKYTENKTSFWKCLV